MNLRKWLLLTLAIVMVMSMATYAGSTMSLFTDDELSTNDSVGIQWGLVSLSDGFENTSDWDANWDENGTTVWYQSSTKAYSGTYSAESTKYTNGYLTTDEMDASSTTEITISFWFNVTGLEPGDFIIERYNGTDYVTWYDITAYSSYVNSQWCLFNETITDTQYLFAGFRLRLNSSAITHNQEFVNIDDVLIVTDNDPPAAPTGLSSTAGDTEIFLDWDDNSEGDIWGYNVYRSLTSGSGYSQVNGSVIPSSNYTDTGLTNGTTYYYVVSAVDYGSNESTYSTEHSQSPVDLAPDAPTGLSATQSEFRVDLDWDDNTEDDFNSYKVYRSTTSGSGYSVISSANWSSSNFSDTGLNNGVTYYYVVTAVDDGSHESAYSSEASATPIDIAPAAPTNLDATAGDRQVFLDWDDNSESDFNSYNVYRSTTSGSGYTKVNSGNVTASVYTDYAVSGGVTYYYMVRAVDDGSNESANSNEDNATPSDDPPAAPTNPSATAGDRLVDLDWDDNVEGDLDGYNVYRSLTSGSGYAKITGSPLTSSEYQDTGLTGGTTYYYVITAVDDGSNESSTSSEVSAVPYDNAPAAPTGFSATTPAEALVSLDWDDNTEDDFNSYNVYRSTTSGGGYTKINSGNVTASAFSDTDVTGGTTYYYVVTAVDGASNESGYSVEADATPYTMPPAAPTGLAATPGERQVSLDWNDNTEPDFNSYNVYRSLTSGSGYAKINTSNVTNSQYTDTGLTGGVTYYYYVTAVDNSALESDNSTEVYGLVYDNPPAAPSGLNASTPAERQISLDWNDNTEDDFNSYNVYRSLTSGSGYALISSANWSTSSWTDTGLTGGTTYYYIVTAVDDTSHVSANSTEVYALAYDYAPAAPTGLGASTPAERQISLDWNDNGESDLNSYRVYRSLTSGSGYALISSANWTSSSWTDTGLTGGVTYYYIVTAMDDTGHESANSTEVYAMAVDNAPAVPANVAATPGDKQVSLDWDDNGESDFNSYNVYRSLTSGSGYALISSANWSTSSWTDTGLTGGVTYYYVVTAVDDTSHASAYSTEASATPSDPAPAVPSNVSATPGAGQVTLTWDANGEADFNSFNVYRSTTSGSGYTKISTDNATTTGYYLDSTVSNGTTYYYVITAVDDASHESAYSTEVNATPSDPAPSAPTGLVATKGVSQVSLDWNDNGESDLHHYNVYRSTTSGSGYVKINASDVTASAYLDSAVTNGTTYYYVVTAVDNAMQESSYSSQSSARPVGPPATLLSDGFESGFGNWDGNGTTNWNTSTITVHSGSVSAHTGNKNNGNLTTDNLNTSTAGTITVSFWFNFNNLSNNMATVNIFNGSSYVLWWDISNYSSYSSGTWCYFSETISYTGSPQYFLSGFRLQFNSTISTGNREGFIDDVVISVN